MKKALLVSFCVLLVLSSLAFARDARKEINPADQRVMYLGPQGLSMDDALPGVKDLHASAQADTYVLASYTWDSSGICIPEGWYGVDRTVQHECYWHVTDFTTEGVTGPKGCYVVPEGLQCLWFGAPASATDPHTCGYATLPGYGGNWNQGWCFKCIEVPDTVDVYLDYLAAWDSEPAYDFTYLEYATDTTCTTLQDVNYMYDWIEVNRFCAPSPDSCVCPAILVKDTILAEEHDGSIRIRFNFISDGGASDEDGGYDSDGAFIMDSITVYDENAVVYDFENFEDETIGDKETADGDWECCIPDPYGLHHGLFPGVGQVQEDPCSFNTTCVWAFFQGSTANYACGGFPAQLAVPYGNALDQYIWNEVWSQPIQIIGSGSRYEWYVETYRDLTIPDCVFYVWHLGAHVGPCWRWGDRGYVYYGPDKDWWTGLLGGGDGNIGDLVPMGTTELRLGVGVIDQCGFWGVHVGGFCSCACHSHSPMWDNFELRRISTTGPVWNMRPLELFQDNFAEDGSATGKCQADMANDITPYGDGVVIEGDSCVVRSVSDPINGMGVGGNGCVAVYCYVNSPHYWRDIEAPEVGPCLGLSATLLRFPVIDSVYACDTWWYQVQLDTVFGSGSRTSPVENRFCVDLNDNLFSPPDTILFFFGGKSTINEWTYYSQFTGTEDDIEEVACNPMEWQCFPTGNSDILYVDRMDGRGAQPYFDEAFELLEVAPDRYDVRAPSSLVGNGPGDRVKNVYNQIIPYYQKIIWSVGNLDNGLIPDGTGDPADEDDAYVLYTFLDQYADSNGCGLYISGDNVADEWQILTGASVVALKTTYIPHNVINPDHNGYGHAISPLVIAEATSQVPFTHALTGDDTLIAYGGCPIINNFDVLQATGHSTEEMTYNDVDGDGAVIAATTTNAQSVPARVVLSGFSFHYIRDDRPTGTPDAVHHMRDILLFFVNDIDPPTPAPKSQFVNALYQNYPNPFNPNTTIKYSIKEKARVSLKIYNVAGQLVRTLVNDVQNPAEVRPIVWYGRNDAGQPVASGVYFYKLVTKNFTQTKKMVLLK